MSGPAPQGKSDAPVALICAGGGMPALVARQSLAKGRTVFVIGLEGMAGPEIAAFDHAWVKLGRIGELDGLLKSRGITRIALVGGLSRPRFSDLSLDFGAVKRLPAMLKILAGGGDDSLLRRLINFIEAGGYQIIGVHDVAPELVIGEGALSARKPSARDSADGRLGLSLLAALSPFDCGQATVVIDNRPVAVEGIEGTDAMLARVADLRASRRLRVKGRRGVLVKAPKRGQDMRVDMPVIGPETLRRAKEAGLAGIMVEAGAVLVAGLDETRAAADREGLFIEGVPSENASSGAVNER
ncbi:MAG: LpxI family protein [Bosea sp. (in: a-proteobacteria)]